MKEKVSVTGVPETMIQTLYARAKESEKDNPMIQDDMAAEIVSKLDYDFSNADKDKAMSYGVIARTIVLDEMVERYLSKNPKTVVINIASGMDTRCYRMKGKYLRWYNVDLPETMEIREKFLTENGPIYQIAKSAMDASYTDEIVCDGEQKGVVSIQVAMRAAEEAGLDLVKIAPQAVPPVCKVLDYGKYRFEQQKKEKEAKKNQKVVEVKETRLSLNIDTNDFNTKLNQTAKFLAAGHKVKVSIRFRGREMAHSALGADVLKRFAEALPQASTDKPPVLEGRTMSILLIPKPNKD